MPDQYKITKIIHHQSAQVVSTQAIAKKLIHTLQPDLCLLVTADRQSNGIATNNKKWESPADCDNIYSTFVIPFPTNKLKNLFNIPQIAGYAVVKALNDPDDPDFNFNSKLKWVNDILINKKKIGGILCETVYSIHLTEYVAVVIGIGLNVNMSQDLCELIDQPATSLMIESRRRINKDVILNKIKNSLIEQIQLFINYNFTDKLHKEINKIMEFLGEEVIVKGNLNAANDIKGIIRGIDSAGLLLIDTGEYVARTASKNLTYTFSHKQIQRLAKKL